MTRLFFLVWIPLQLCPYLPLEVDSKRSATAGSTFDESQPNTARSLVCPTLVNPPHGKYVCEEKRRLGIRWNNDDVNITCTLKCNRGYLIPVVQLNPDDKPMPLEDRGVYKCNTNPGKYRQWEPPQFFDCIPSTTPKTCAVYFFLKILPIRASCSPHYAKMHRKALFAKTSNFVTNMICFSRKVQCKWDFNTECIDGNTVWKVVITLRYRFRRHDFVFLKQLFSKLIRKDAAMKIKINGIAPSSQINENFKVFCPRGTMFAKDFKCHGCSKGFYMDERLTLCKPCPVRFFQDKDIQTTCKACPNNSHAVREAGGHITSCYQMHELLQETDILTMTFCVTTVVTFLFCLIILKSGVDREMETGAKKQKPKWVTGLGKDSQTDIGAPNTEPGQLADDSKKSSMPTSSKKSSIPTSSKTSSMPKSSRYSSYDPREWFS